MGWSSENICALTHHFDCSIIIQPLHVDNNNNDWSSLFAFVNVNVQQLHVKQLYRTTSRSGQTSQRHQNMDNNAVSVAPTLRTGCSLCLVVCWFGWWRHSSFENSLTDTALGDWLLPRLFRVQKRVDAIFLPCRNTTEREREGVFGRITAVWLPKVRKKKKCLH